MAKGSRGSWISTGDCGSVANNGGDLIMSDGWCSTLRLRDLTVW